MYAYVRQPHGSWEDAQIEVVSLADPTGEALGYPKIDGADCVILRTADGRRCAITWAAFLSLKAQSK